MNGSPERSPQVEKFLWNKENTEQVIITPENFPPELVREAERLQELTHTWNPVEFVTASSGSIAREKAKLFENFEQGRGYNPVFEYPAVEQIEIDIPKAEAEIRDVLKQVRAFPAKTRAEQIAKVALYYKAKDDLATVDLISGIREKDEKKIKQAVNTKYAGTDPVLLSVAEGRYQEAIAVSESVVDTEGASPLLSPEQQTVLKETILNVEQVKESLEWLLNCYGMLRTEENPEGFQVKISSEVTAPDVRDKSSEPMTIYLPVTYTSTAERLLALMYHEIEGHARQSMNGKKFWVGGGALKVDDEALYEGLAMRHEEDYCRRFLGEMVGTSVPYIVFGIAQAEAGADFMNIFRDQVDRRLHVALKVEPTQAIDYTDAKTQAALSEAMQIAWVRTYRVMRGHVDTSNPEGFAFPKDLAYLRGGLIDRQLVASGFGHINEAAIMQTNALPLMGRLSLGATDPPFPFQDLTRRYCFEILLPRLMAAQKENSSVDRDGESK